MRELTSRAPATGAAALSSGHPLTRHSLFPGRRCPVPMRRVAESKRKLNCSLRVEEASASNGSVGPAVSEVLTWSPGDQNASVPENGFAQEEETRDEDEDENEEEENEEEEEGKGISRIGVSREKYIPVSKAELLDAVVLKLFSSQNDDASPFLLVSSCLDSILHAEHKQILEGLRSDYLLAGNEEEESEGGESVGDGEVNGVEGAEGGEESLMELRLRLDYGLDLRRILGSSSANGKRVSYQKNRLAVASRFQRAFMQLLDDAQFQELSARDLKLASALNSDYLLTLPIYVDWKKASESNAIIFRRGYATERQKGLMIVEKLDYLQSRLLQKVFSLISKPLGKIGSWIKEGFSNAFQTQEVQDLVNRMRIWQEDFSLFQKSYFSNGKGEDYSLGIDQLSEKELPIWLAAQRAVSRYEGFLSPVGPRGRLFRKLLTRVGLLPPVPETTLELESDDIASEPHLSPIFLSRISLSDIWRPATRKYCGNNLWKMLRSSVSILLSQSVLQEPAFQELILLYTKEANGVDSGNKFHVPSLQLKIYERIPIPDLSVIFPDKKLSFRIIDTVRLDLAALVGLSAYFINYKFENILSSPSAVLLDVVAITALIINGTRVGLGYKQTWDRYQLLVNKTLYEKTLASGFGAVHFLLDASEQQQAFNYFKLYISQLRNYNVQYKEALLTYAILLKVKKGQDSCRRSLGLECERFMYNVFRVKVEMPVDKALSTLVRLGLVIETPLDGRTRIRAIPCEEANEALKKRWNNLLSL